MSSARVTWLALTPRDAIHIRDGRQFTAGDGTTAETAHPWPSTIAGAVGAAYGMEPLDVRGPVLALHDGDAWEPYLPVPADLAWSGPGDTVIRLSPGPSGEVATDLGDGLTLLRSTAGDVSARPLSGVLPAAVMTDYLDGTLVGGAQRASAARLRLAASPVVPERRAGFALAAGTAMPGYSYQAAHLRLRDDWAYLAACRLPGHGPSPSGPVQLGGRGRQADITEAPGADWPASSGRFPGGRLLAYVATPAIWPAGWRIPLPDGARLAAAAVGKPLALATATPGRLMATRALHWAVPPGSVYLLDFGNETAAARWAARHHGEAYGRPEADRLRTAGFGVILTGAWT